MNRLLDFRFSRRRSNSKDHPAHMYALNQLQQLKGGQIGIGHPKPAAVCNLSEVRFELFDRASRPSVEKFLPNFGKLAGRARHNAKHVDALGLGYLGGAAVFGAGLAIIAALYFWTKISRVLLFWGAFILTRPLGATVGDFLDKPLNHGGLALSRPVASGILAVTILVLILIIPQRPGRHPDRQAAAV